jgi:hypothetical protein
MLLKIYLDKNHQFEMDPTDPPAIKKAKQASQQCC